MTHAPSTGLSRWQLASRTGSHAGRDPGPDYRQVALPALRPSGFAPSLERGGKPGSPSARGLTGDPLVAAQSPSFPPGKLKLSCSDFNRGLKDKLTRSLAHSHGKGQGQGHTNITSQKRERALRSQCLGSHPYPRAGEESLRPAPRAAWRPQGPQHAKGLHGWPRGKRRDTPRLRGVTLARPPAGRKPPGPGKRPSPAYRVGWGSRELHFPLGCGDGGSHPPYRVATLSGQPKEQDGKRPTRAEAKTRALLTGRSPSAKPARAPQRCPPCSYVTAPW